MASPVTIIAMTQWQCFAHTLLVLVFLAFNHRFPQQTPLSSTLCSSRMPLRRLENSGVWRWCALIDTVYNRECQGESNSLSLSLSSVIFSICTQTIASC